MILDLQRQDSGRSTLEIEGSMALQIAGKKPDSLVLLGSLVVNNLDSRILLSGDLRGSGEGICDRCLEPCQVDIEVPVDILVLRDTEAENEDDSFVIHQKTGEVDLRPVLREAVLLALPQQLVCREDCLGLCPQCGTNRNLENCDCAASSADPRWDNLPG